MVLNFEFASNISDLFLRPFSRLVVTFSSVPDKSYRDPNDEGRLQSVNGSH
jgi:hypothetical protein